MAKIFDVAEWFLQKESMTHKKLQKMCYYAQAWSYTLRDCPIADDTTFEAWVHGPVSPMLYDKYRESGWTLLESDNRELPFDEIEIDLLESIYITYSEMSANEIEALSHSEPPWLNARRGYSPDARSSAPILIDDMKDYYKSIYIGDD